MKKIIPFVCFWVINGIFIDLASLIRPQNYVLGNARLTAGGSIFWTSFWITVIVWFAKPLISKLKISVSLEGRTKMFIFYWVCTTIVIWLAARVPFLTGFGISRFYWAIALGLVLNIVQWALWQVLKTQKLVVKR